MARNYSVHDKFVFDYYDPEDRDRTETLTAKEILKKQLPRVLEFCLKNDRLQVLNANDIIEDYVLINFGTKVDE